MSEREVGGVLRSLFADRSEQRIIVACFSSHLHRIQQIAEAAIGQERIIATLGRSMAKNVQLGRQLGLLRIPDANLIDIEKIGDISPE